MTFQSPALLITFWLSIGAVTVGAFLLGWDLSVRRFRSRQRELRSRYLVLKTQIDQLTEEMTSDPVEFGVRTGQNYVLDRLSALVDSLRD